MNTTLKTYLNSILRFVFGGVFIFSGFVKAVDPMGTAYKIEEYMSAFNFQWLVDSASWLPIVMSVLLCSFEFIIGIMIFCHIYKKPSKIIAAAFMIFFTITTLIDALTNKVSDCGCFGDAVKLTNWQTFYKNIILDVVLLLIFIFDSKQQKINKKYSSIIGGIFASCVLLFCIYNLMYEPVIDFRPWKVGNKMAPKINEQKPMVTYAVYKNNKTGQEKEYSMDELMKAYNSDAEFASHWTFVTSRAINPNEIKAAGFSLTPFMSNDDESLEVLSDTVSDLYIVGVVALDKASDKGMKKVSEFAKRMYDKGNRVIVITATNPNKWYDFITKYDLKNYMIYACDDKAIEAMIRSNPGVVKISKTIVKDKWSWRQLPKD